MNALDGVSVGLLNPDQIKSFLPHREPFLFLDEVESIDVWQCAIGYRKFSEEYFFRGHFPGYPVVPGVILIEAMAQLATVCVAYSCKQDGKEMPKGVAFMSIDKAKFRNPVVQDARVKFIVNQTKARGSIFQFVGKGFIGDVQVCEAEFMAMSKKTV